MRQFLALLLCLGIVGLPFPAGAQTDSSTFRMVAKGNVTNANMTATLTAGSADVDFTSAIIPHDYQGYLLVLRDSTNIAIKGWISTAGTGTIRKIKSTKGGSTQNWTVQETGFNNNDSSGYTYEIWQSTTVPVVASGGTITQTNTSLDLTDTNAFVWLNGVDLSPYQDGRHMIGIYNVTGGYGILGHISSVAPGGETLGSDLFNVGAGVFTSGTYSWVPYGTNTIENDSNSLKVTYVNNSQCAYDFLRSGDSDLSSDMVIKNLYKLTVDAKVNAGSSVRLNKSFGGSDSNNSIITVTDFTTVIFYGTAQSSVRDSYINFSLMGSGEIIWLDNLVLKNVTDPPSTGARIVSTKGGSTREFYYKNASFNPNSAGGVTYKIFYVGDTAQVDQLIDETGVHITSETGVHIIRERLP